MGQFFAKLYVPGQLDGPKNLEKLFLDRYIKWLLEIILSEFLGPSMWPGKNNSAKNCPCTARVAGLQMFCLLLMNCQTPVKLGKYQGSLS